MKLAADWRLAVATGGAAGLAAAPFWSPGGGWVRPLIVLVFVSALLGERGRLTGSAVAMVGLAACLAGLLVGGARIEAIDGGALKADPGPAQLSGFVLEMPSGSRGTLRFAVETEDGRLLAESRSGQVDGILPGTGIDLSGELGPAPDWMRADLERRGIQMVLTADRTRVNGSRRQGLAGWIDRLRDRAFAALEVAVPEREAALSRGFVLGEDSAIDQQTTEDFRRSGLGHLLSYLP